MTGVINSEKVRCHKSKLAALSKTLPQMDHHLFVELLKDARIAGSETNRLVELGVEVRLPAVVSIEVKFVLGAHLNAVSHLVKDCVLKHFRLHEL